MNELFRHLLALPEQASTVAKGIDTLHYIVISVSLLGALAVAAAVGLFLIRFHAGRTYTAARHSRRIPVWVEGIVIAGLLGMFLLFWVVGFRQFVTIQRPPPNTYDVYVVAKKWMWTFAYPDGNATNGDVYVPANRPVRLLMTSRDVIHSFFVPDFRVKQDVLPGRTTVLWFEAKHPGTFDVFCAEYCGTEHSKMRARVIALDPSDLARWAEGAKTAGVTPPREDLATIGEKVAADRGCLRCHTVDGTPHLGPTWAGLYGSTVPLADGTKVTADAAYLTESMMDPMRKIHAGFAPIMPTYFGLIQGGEVAALVEYIRSLPANPAAGPLPSTAPLPTQPAAEPRASNP